MPRRVLSRGRTTPASEGLGPGSRDGEQELKGSSKDPVQQHFSDFDVLLIHRGLLLKCRLRLSRSGVGPDYTFSVEGLRRHFVKHGCRCLPTPQVPGSAGCSICPS